MEITVDLFSAMSERNQITARAHKSLDQLTRLIEDRADMSQVGGLPSLERESRSILKETSTTPQE